MTVTHCPHFDGEVIGTTLPKVLTFPATFCPTCRIWLRRGDDVPLPRDLAHPPRRMGFTPLPVRCACGRRLEQPSQLVHGTVLRCDACFQQQYAWFVQPVRLAFVIEVQSHEVADMAARALSLPEVLRELGAMRDPMRGAA
jgi:hypothetical protein